MTLDELEGLLQLDSPRHFIAESEEAVLGVMGRDKALEAAKDQGTIRLAGIAGKDFVTVLEDAPLLDVIHRIRNEGASAAVVEAADKTPACVNDVKGIIAKEQVADAALEALDLF